MEELKVEKKNQIASSMLFLAWKAKSAREERYGKLGKKLIYGPQKQCRSPKLSLHTLPHKLGSRGWSVLIGYGGIWKKDDEEEEGRHKP